MMNLTEKQLTQSDKILMSVCVLALASLVYALAHFKTAKVKFTKNEVSPINYEMAKLQNADNLYSLENREIELNYKALETKKVPAKADVKNLTDKTKKVITPAAQASVQNTVAHQVTAQRKAQTKRLQAQAAARMAHTETSVDQPENNSKQKTNAAQEHYKPVDNMLPRSAPPIVEKKSFDQWKSEIFAAQSKEAIMKLVVALKKGEVTNEMFQRLAAELTASKDDKIVGLGLYALRSAPSYLSYVQLVKVQASVNSSYATYVQESLMAYNQNANLVFLKQSLTSKDKEVVMKTLEIIKLGITNIKDGEVAGMADPRYVRGTAATQFSLTNYLSFLPLLQQLTRSSDQDIVALAHQNITLIDDPQYIAAN